MVRQFNIKVAIIALLMGVVVLLPSFQIKVSATLIEDISETSNIIGTDITSSLDTNPVLELNSAAGIDELCNKVNSVSQDIAGFNFITKGSTSTGKSKITLDMKTYTSDTLSSDDRRDIIETALTVVNDSNNISGQAKTRIYNFISNQDAATASLVRQLSNDVNADFATAYSWFKPFTGGISTVLGVLALAIFTAMGVMIIVDLSYLSIPLVQLWLSSSSGGKAKLISNEAWFAIQEAEKDAQSNKSALGIYFKRKSIQLVIISVCLLYLVGGKMYSLVAWVIDSFQGFVN